MTIGERIKKTRKEKGMTQKQVAEQCGMADSAIRKYESGSQKPKLETLCKIAAALGVSPSFLAGLDPLVDTPENRKVVDEGFISFGKAMEEISAWKGPKQTAESISSYFTEPSDEDYLLMAFDELNDKGKRIAIERVEELGKIPEYREENVRNEFSKAQRVIHGSLPRGDNQSAVDPQEND